MFGRIVRVSLFLVAALILGAGFTYLRIITVVAPSEEKVSFTIEKGEGPKKVATKLKEAGLLTNDRSFLLHVLLTNKRNAFYPGTYTLTQGQSIRSVVSTLTNPIQQQIKITVLEGWRINDIAQEIGKKTKVSTADFKLAAPVETYEGYLFPDTYYFAPETSAEAMVKTMRDNFDHRTRDLNLTADDVKLASIVEREARTDEDRAKVAGVYLNRLSIDMALEADPTVQYAKGSWGTITLADYRSVQSPYNAYLNVGLPPTPIASAGLASLKAVKAPAQHDYIFFFHTSKGETYYSKTLQEHNVNKQKYLR